MRGGGGGIELGHTHRHGWADIIKINQASSPSYTSPHAAAAATNKRHCPEKEETPAIA